MSTSDDDKTKRKVIQILVDDREKNDRLLSTLRKAEDTFVRIGRLVIGDYLLENLLVERKSFIDLCMSIKDGRLFRQAAQLALASAQPVIILEGNANDLKATGMKREAIQGALITLMLLFRIPILRSLSPEETARLMLFSARQIANAKVPRQAYPRFSRGRNRINQKQKLQIHILQGFPGIGLARSVLLLNRFGTLSAIFKASPEELAEVPGLGKALIKSILDLLN